ncbi:MAG: putative asparagine synthetase [glutamine-hydrolyzing] [Saprospiraceae bacterium]|jgi:asparagine synthase (glutamine-hydrolysing)|nr:putative asparagine synthetase [glutamine-hydrolyzing] [Saprospiraceae bacterium]
MYPALSTELNANWKNDMCGIAGIVSEDPRVLDRLDGPLIRHRGPDDEGAYRDDTLHLQHFRLAIQDLSANARQPMTSADGRYVLIFNGEIYNHRDIRMCLPDALFYRSTSDTETVLQAFIHWGTAAFSRFNGIFALALYDRLERKLVLARDQYGVKPLYWASLANGFAFASELKALIGLPGMDTSPDLAALAAYIQCLWSPGERTPVRSVRKLTPGSWMEIKCEHPFVRKTQKYYLLPYGAANERNRSLESWVEELDERLFVAVGRQLLSDVPVGLFVSGGLDSSLIAAMVRRHRPGLNIQGFTVANAFGNTEGFTDDLPFARKVAQQFDIDLVPVSVQSSMMVDIDSMVWSLDEPQADLAPLLVSSIAAQSRLNGVPVLLSGAGGDDLFSGYRRHQALVFDRVVSHIPPSARRVLGNLIRQLPRSSPAFRRLSRYATGLEFQSLDQRIVGYYDWLSGEETRRLFAASDDSEWGEEDVHATFLHALSEIPPSLSPLSRQLYLELRFYLPDHNLNYTDKMGMKHGVEVRVPFLDTDLVEFSCRIPDGMKMKGLTTKYLLRKVAERYLPREVIYRSKTGFGGPVRQWVKEGLRQRVSLEFDPAHLIRQGIFDPKAVWNLVDKNNAGQRDLAYPIFALLAIQSWLRQFTPQT